MAKSCPQCGCPITTETICPDCGYSLADNSENTSSLPQNPTTPITPSSTNHLSLFDTDWAQYVYECGVIAWKAFKKSFCFTGRASRREYWSLAITLYSAAFIWECASTSADIFNSPLYLIILLPLLSAGIRRVHDCGKNGWWSVCPFACFFLFLKKSDESINKYGNPNPAKNLLL